MREWSGNRSDSCYLILSGFWKSLDMNHIAEFSLK